jgi:hypothetical protein
VSYVVEGRMVKRERGKQERGGEILRIVSCLSLACHDKTTGARV